jgi:hypothetical protein
MFGYKKRHEELLRELSRIQLMVDLLLYDGHAHSPEQGNAPKQPITKLEKPTTKASIKAEPVIIRTILDQPLKSNSSKTLGPALIASLNKGGASLPIIMANFPSFTEPQLEDALDKLEGKKLVETYISRTTIDGVSKKRVLYRGVENNE